MSSRVANKLLRFVCDESQRWNCCRLLPRMLQLERRHRERFPRSPRRAWPIRIYGVRRIGR